MKQFVYAAVLCMAATPALGQAKIDFALYEGPPIIETGTGGTKITKHGVDYWTSGTPPRRYQVIGRVTDSRDEEWDGGRALGSPGIAKRVKAAGGSAVIMLNQDTVGGSSVMFGSLFGGSGMMFGGGGSKTQTAFVVVRYLEPAAP